MSMSELHKPEWYGEYAVIKNKYLRLPIPQMGLVP